MTFKRIKHDISHASFYILCPCYNSFQILTIFTIVYGKSEVLCDQVFALYWLNSHICWAQYLTKLLLFILCSFSVRERFLMLFCAAVALIWIVLPCIYSADCDLWDIYVEFVLTFQFLIETICIWDWLCHWVDTY